MLPNLSTMLNEMDKENLLPKTVLYSLNPNDNEMLASMAGNFQGGGIRGKMQFGTAWWFNDHKPGMEAQLTVLSSIGLISPFIGMLTDSRSFLSFPRHEYFRRILCNVSRKLGRERRVPESSGVPEGSGEKHQLQQRIQLFLYEIRRIRKQPFGPPNAAGKSLCAADTR